jgi:anti-sigma-K factor RskA
MSSPDQSKGDRSRDEVLAGEYGLGVLSLEDRQKVERRMRNDRPFAAIVTRWEQNLSSFNDEYEALMPSPTVFPKVERRVFGDAGPAKGTSSSLWNSLVLWRTLAVASLVIAAAVVALNPGVTALSPRKKPLVAALGAENSAINLVASYDVASGRLKVTPVAAGKPEEKSLQMWLIRGSNPAISLGVLPQTGEGEISIPQNIRGQLAEGVVLAVSVEPFGGSPTGVPTGPVVASGAVHLP